MLTFAAFSPDNYYFLLICLVSLFSVAANLISGFFASVFKFSFSFKREAKFRSRGMLKVPAQPGTHGFVLIT